MALPPGAGTPPPDDATLSFQQVQPRWPLPPPPATQFPPPPQVQPRSDAARGAGGFTLLLIPLAALVIAYVLPTIRTVQLSTQAGIGLDGLDDVGGANYDRIAEEGLFWDGVAHLLGPTGLLVLGGAVIAPMLALLIHRAGPAVRAVSRVAWTLAALSFAPAALTTAWLIERVVSERDTEATVYDWPLLVSGVVIGTGVLACLAALRGEGRRTGALAATAGLTAIALAAAGLQTFAYGTISGLPAETPVPLRQVFEGVRTGLDVGLGTAKSVLLLVILAVLGIGAAVLFAAARVRIDAESEPTEPASARAVAAIPALAVLLIALAAVGYFLLPWLARIGEGAAQPVDQWFLIRRTWGPPLVTTGIALLAAAAGGFAVGALRPLGDASRWLLLPFAPWLFVGTGPLAAAHLQAVADEGEWVVIGSFPPRAWIAIPLLFLFTALCWGLEDRRRAAVENGVPRGAAKGAFLKAALPFALLAAMVLLLVHVQDLFWSQLTYQDMLSSGVMVHALANLEFEDSGVGYGFPLPVLIPYALAAVALAVWYLPRLAVRTGRP
ncbi:hypothetical protein GCM10009853_011220 [Glycomyces scopariae]